MGVKSARMGGDRTKIPFQRTPLVQSQLPDEKQRKNLTDKTIFIKIQASVSTVLHSVPNVFGTLLVSHTIDSCLLYYIRCIQSH